MANERDYYSALEINRRATEQEIEAAYRRLSRIYEPSVSRKRRASRRWQQITEAYGVLSDRRRRLEYDRWLASRRGKGAGVPFGSQTVVEEERGMWARLASRPLAWAGAGAAVVALAVALVLMATLGGGGGGNETAASGTQTPSASVTPSASTTVTGGGPESPPEVAGEKIATGTGLKYIDIQEGTGAQPAQGQTVVVNYTGWLESSGKKFDSSLDRGETFEFTLGVGEVITGWDEGLATMKVGGKRRLIVPPEMGYGAEGRPPTIPANSTLIFDVELVGVK